MKRILLLCSFVFLISGIYAQDVVLDMDVEDQYKSTRGPNMQKYGYLYSSVGAIPDFDEEGSTSINFWHSFELITGYRHKRKLLPFYSLGFDFSFIITRYFFDEDILNDNIEIPVVSFPTDVKKHFLTNNAFALEVYQRFNIGPHGNTLGNYLDMGIYGQWNHTAKEVHVLESDDAAASSDKLRIVKRKLDFIETWGYGVSGRIGHNKLAIYGRYRLSDYFISNYNLPELPRLTLGLEFSL